MPTATEIFVQEYHQHDPIHLSNAQNDRLWVHDLLHAIVQGSPKSARGEEMTAIYQSVLLRDDKVSPRRKDHMDSGKDVTLEVVKTEIIPGVREFLQRLGRRYGFTSKPALSDVEIEAHYARAKRMETAFLQEFGRPLGDIPVSELKSVPLETYLRIAASTQERAEPFSKSYMSEIKVGRESAGESSIQPWTRM